MRRHASPCDFHSERVFHGNPLFASRDGSSRLHRICADTLRHFYLGGPLRLILHEDPKPKAAVQEVPRGQNFFGRAAFTAYSDCGLPVWGQVMSGLRVFRGELRSGAGL